MRGLYDDCERMNSFQPKNSCHDEDKIKPPIHLKKKKKKSVIMSKRNHCDFVGIC